jgi:hypothetical protein
MALLRVPIRILIATTHAPFEAAQDERLISPSTIEPTVPQCKRICRPR